MKYIDIVHMIKRADAASMAADQYMATQAANKRTNDAIAQRKHDLGMAANRMANKELANVMTRRSAIAKSRLPQDPVMPTNINNNQEWVNAYKQNLDARMRGEKVAPMARPTGLDLSGDEYTAWLQQPYAQAKPAIAAQPKPQAPAPAPTAQTAKVQQQARPGMFRRFMNWTNRNSMQG